MLRELLACSGGQFCYQGLRLDFFLKAKAKAKAGPRGQQHCWRLVVAVTKRNNRIQLRRAQP